MMKILQISFTLWVGCLVAGCDLGTYSSRYNERVGQMTSMSNTNKDLGNDLIDIKNVAKIRVPKVCNNEYSISFGENDVFTKARIPGIEIEGFAKSFMGDKQASDGSWFPFQVYTYYIPGKTLEEVKSIIKAAVNGVLKQTTVSWDVKTVESYDGKEFAWASSTIGAGQPFFVVENEEEKKKDLNGRLDFYATANDRGVMVIAFRAPSSVFAVEDEPLVEGTLKSIQGFK